MPNKIILASKSKVRKEILDKNNIKSDVLPSNVDEDIVKKSLLKEKASPEIISKNLAELKANKVSLKKTDKIVLGADSVIDLNGELISKPETREEALTILKKLNGKSHFLISSVCLHIVSHDVGVSSSKLGRTCLLCLLYISIPIRARLKNTRP